LDCRDDINIAIVFKAMGAESDQEIMQLVAHEEELMALMIPTIQDAKAHAVSTQAQALDYLGGSVIN
jgi:DNA-directed RNA polymerase III subunit RPC2